MKILVCVKAVPETESRFRVNARGNGYDEAGLVFHPNEYDVCALEEALRIKERFGAVEITVLSVGPPRVEEQVRKVMGLGADQGVVIDDGEAPVRDALATASLIAAWAKPGGFDLILAGVMSEDLQRCQTGPMTAQILGLPCATTVIKQEIAEDQESVTCERELEGGLRERVQLPLPALLTIQSGINVPRYAGLSNVLRIKKMEIPKIPASALPPVNHGERVVRAYPPKTKSHCEFLDGEPGAVAEKLVEIIRERTRAL